MSANGGGRRAQFLPVGLFRDQLVAFGLDHVGGVGHVLAQLRVAQHREAPLRETAAQARIHDGGWLVRGVAHRRASSSDAAAVLARIRPVNRLHALLLAMQRAAQMHQAAVVECGAVLGAGRQHVGQLGRRAWPTETSAFFTENVPPNPQQRSRFASGTQFQSAHLAQ